MLPVMKTLLFPLVITFVAVLVACKEHILEVPDTTCNLPDAGLVYRPQELAREGKPTWSACSFVKSFVVGYYCTDDRHIVLVQGTRKGLKLSKEEQIFDLAKTDTAALKVSVYKYKVPIWYAMFCYDLVHYPTNVPVEQWTSVGGKISVQMLADSVGFRPEQVYPWYKVKMKVTNCIVMKKPDKTLVKLATPQLGTFLFQ